MIRKLSPHEADKLAREQGAQLIDIREPDEFLHGRIEGAALQPLSAIALLPPDTNKDKAAIYFCASGRRTEASLPTLESRGHEQVYYIDGGYGAWKKAGLPVQESSQPLPLMRQVHLAAGTLIILFSLLGITWPLFRLLAALVGVGLLTSGLTGKCGMGLLLACMPWNKKR